MPKKLQQSAEVVAKQLDQPGGRVLTRQDLLAIASAGTNYDTKPHYFYTGTKGGCDYVAQLWGASHGQGGYVGFLVRAGELRIERRHDVSDKYSEWQELDLSRQ